MDIDHLDNYQYAKQVLDYLQDRYGADFVLFRAIKKNCILLQNNQPEQVCIKQTMMEE